MQKDYVTVRDFAQDEFVVKKSRFIGYSKHVESEAEAMAFVQEISKKHWDATHNVYAFSLRDGMTRRYSDDGEPQGTAGVPVLDVILKEDIVNVCVVVTRYFGGILLGAGGLTRAYSQGAKDALVAAGAATMGLWAQAAVPCTYALFERVKLEIAALGGVIDDTEYGADICLYVSLMADTVDALQKRLTELSSGSLKLEVLDEEYRPGPREEVK